MRKIKKEQVAEEIRKIVRLEIRTVVDGMVRGNTKPESISKIIADRISNLAYSKKYVFTITPNDVLEVIEELFPNYELKCEAIIGGIIDAEIRLKKM